MTDHLHTTRVDTARLDTDHTATTGVELLDVLDAIRALPEADPAVRGLPPILGSGQRQGDVFVQPDRLRIGRRERRTAVRLADGQEIVIVPDGHRHVLRAVVPAGGLIRVWGQRVGNVVLSMQIVAPAYALLVQPSGPNPHLPLGIAPGRYVICRQSEPRVLATSTATDTFVVD